MTAQQQGSNNCPSSRQGAEKENSPLRPVASGANNLSRKAYRRCCCCFATSTTLLSFTNRPNALQMTPIYCHSQPRRPARSHRRAMRVEIASTGTGPGAQRLDILGTELSGGTSILALRVSVAKTLFFFFFFGGGGVRPGFRVCG